MTEHQQPANHYISCGHGTSVMREWHQIPVALTPANFVYPIFVTDEAPDIQKPIAALPGQFHLGVERVVKVIRPMVEKYGLRSVIVFGVATKSTKDNRGSPADDANGPAIQALKALRAAFTKDELLLMADVCICPYTSHGHCGVVGPDDEHLDNPESVKRMGEISVAYAKAGADVIAPSDMMDTRVAAIKSALRSNGFAHVPVMSYSAKFASSLYGPFRSACATNLKGDRRAYQLPPGSIALAERAVRRDIAEGADFIMVKPGTMYLDVIRMCREVGGGVPVAVYHVSGEYAMMWHASKAGALDLRAAVLESMQSMRRAGADIILTYYTPMILQWLADGNEHGRNGSKL
eukprot:PhM_4_TR14944/c0_g1_i1/m.18395/K01698/hemB, ALAD; porphobilinogen synthase